MFKALPSKDATATGTETRNDEESKTPALAGTKMNASVASNSLSKKGAPAAKRDALENVEQEIMAGKAQ